MKRLHNSCFGSEDSFRFSVRWRIVVLCCASVSLSCGFDERATECSAETVVQDCGPNGVCHLGYCASSQRAGANTGGRGGSTGMTGTTTGNSSMQPANAGASGSDASDPSLTGAGAGAYESSGPCAAGMTPSSETCNGSDDDCDGTVDEDSTVSCYPEATPGCQTGADGSCRGACMLGTQTCTAGALTACTGAVMPVAEVCTASASDAASDEDCDGRVDEQCECQNGQSTRCYDGPQGTRDIGACRSGTQRCVDATWSACKDSLEPTAETCANQGADDDCNGSLDDIGGLGDPCSVPAVRGACALGSWRCVAGSAQTACVSDNVPSMELCNGADDDCDGVTDNGFDLTTDRNHCGACSTVCSTDESCCAGGCVAGGRDAVSCGGAGASGAGGAGAGGAGAGAGGAGPGPGGRGGQGGAGAGAGAGGTSVAGQGGSAPPVAGTSGGCGSCARGQVCCGDRCVREADDVNHCGGCDIVCRDGRVPGCCGGRCVDLMDNATCGSCDVSCGLLTNDNSDRTCSCGTYQGEIRCIGAAIRDVCVF